MSDGAVVASWGRLPLLLGLLAASWAAPLTLPAQEAQPLEDNSFLIEEAYNQGPGVVQEISTFTRIPGGTDWIYTFTQEWPLGGVRHQLSYTIPLEHHGSFATTGLGDALLNYRYQLVGSGDERIHVSPRLSAILPTGRAASGRGSGSFGGQVSLPLSVTFGPSFAAHANAGFTVLPSAQDPAGEQATTTSFSAGASVLWLVRPLFNFLVEAIWLDVEQVVADRETARQRVALLNPGFRWGFNLRGGLQIVTGLAYTLGLNDASSDALFVYLSFEHPFRKISE